MSGEWWSMMTIVGPILFVVVLLWVIFHNRQSRAEEQRTEQATHELQAAEEARLKDMQR